MNRKVLGSILAIGAVVAVAGGSTFALFSDTEASQGNTFAAGELDLKVDYEESYNGEFIDEQNFTDNPEAIFNINDVKPGDQGEANVSLHNQGNPALVSMTLDNVTGAENDCSEPEANVDSSCGNPGTGEGELGENLYLTVTDNSGEIVYNGSAADLENQEADLGQFDANSTEYINVEWYVPRETGNIIQTDSYSFDMSFTAVQARHNNGTAQAENPESQTDNNVTNPDQTEDDETEVEVSEETQLMVNEVIQREVSQDVEVEIRQIQNIEGDQTLNVIVNQDVDQTVIQNIKQEIEQNVNIDQNITVNVNSSGDVEDDIDMNQTDNMTNVSDNETSDFNDTEGNGTDMNWSDGNHTDSTDNDSERNGTLEQEIEAVKQIIIEELGDDIGFNVSVEQDVEDQKTYTVHLHQEVNQTAIQSIEQRIQQEVAVDQEAVINIEKGQDDVQDSESNYSDSNAGVNASADLNETEDDLDSGNRSNFTAPEFLANNSSDFETGTQ